MKLVENPFKKKLLGFFITILFVAYYNDASFANKAGSPLLKSFLTDTTVVITPKESRIFYAGMRNPITISVKGVSLQNIMVSIDNGTISGQNGEYNVSPRRWGNATITVSIEDRIIHQEAFRVKLVPPPVACVAGLQGESAATKAQLQKAGGLSVYMPGFYSLYTVSKFSMSSNAGSAASNSDKFTEQQLKIIQKTTVGKTLYFGDIHATGADGTRRKLSTFSIKIK